jgi:methyl-accepting chemotaxis protein
MIETLEGLRAKVGRAFVGLLVLAALTLAAAGLVLGTGGLPEAGLIAAIALVAEWERRRHPAGLGVQLTSSAGLALAVAAFVWLLRGSDWQIDGHMAFFAAFALTALYCDWRPIVMFAAVTAVHHLVLNYVLTAAVFPGSASLGRVLFHAVIVVLQALPMIWMARVLAGLFARSGAALAGAQVARDAAEAAAEAQSAEREETAQIIDRLGQTMARLAQGDLAARLSGQMPPRYRGLQGQFNEFVQAIERMVGAIAGRAQGLSRSSDALSEASKRSADRAGEQSVTLEQAADALRVLTGAIEETAGRARDADARMTANRQGAQAGGEILSRAVEAMRRIEESSNQISRISEVMEDIAFQTNLLALNAGVEAARAGEAGKGFAVVAIEVRALAMRASGSAKEIKTLVQASRANVTEGSELVQRTHGSLGELITGAGESAIVVAEIAAQMQRQSQGLTELSTTLRELEKAARDGAGLADQSSAMSAALKDDAAALIAAAQDLGRAETAAQPRAA